MDITTFAVVLIGLQVWVLVAVVVGIGIGQMIRMADHRDYHRRNGKGKQ